MWRMQEVLFRMSLKSEPTSTVRDLGQGHVIPTMAPPNWRGICIRRASTQTSATNAHRQDRPRYGMRGERRGVSYRLVHQAPMITSWAMAVSMV